MDIFQRIITGPSERFLERALDFLPTFPASLLIFFAGMVLGALLRFVSLFLFRAIGPDRPSGKCRRSSLERLHWPEGA